MYPKKIETKFAKKEKNITSTLSSMIDGTNGTTKIFASKLKIETFPKTNIMYGRTIIWTARVTFKISKIEDKMFFKNLFLIFSDSLSVFLSL